MPNSPARGTPLTRNYKLTVSPVRALSPARVISLYRPFAVYELASELYTRPLSGGIDVHVKGTRPAAHVGIRDPGVVCTGAREGGRAARE